MRKTIRFLFLMVFILLLVPLEELKAQDGRVDGYLNSGGTNFDATMGLVGCIGEPVIGLLTQDWQHCLQGFAYKTIPANFVTSSSDLLNLEVRVKLFPNPVSEFLNISYDGILNGNEMYLISDEGGRLVNKGKLTGPITQLNTVALRPGAYAFLLINSITKKKIYNNKFIKIK